MSARNIVLVAGLLFANLIPATAGYSRTSDEEKQKLDQDPTKVITKFGIAYGDAFSVSASFAFDPVRKINVRLNEDLGEWRAGGSWLFPFGIVNVNVGRNEFDHGGSQNNYSIGTFIPLSTFGIAPWGIQIFPTAGYTYNDGDIPCDTSTNPSCQALDPEIDEDYVLVAAESHSGYLGMFGLKQVSERWTAISVLNGSIGTNDYQGMIIGAGMACQITKRQSVKMIGGYIDNSYGSEGKLVVGYSYQLN